MAARSFRVHDLIRLGRYAPEDVEAIAIRLRRRALEAKLPDVAAFCVAAVHDARAAADLAERYEAQRKIARRRGHIPKEVRIYSAQVDSRVKDAREALYVALLIGLVRARGPRGAAVRSSLWAPFREVGRLRYKRWKEEAEAIRRGDAEIEDFDADNHVPTWPPPPPVRFVILPDPPGPPAPVDEPTLQTPRVLPIPEHRD